MLLRLKSNGLGKEKQGESILNISHLTRLGIGSAKSHEVRVVCSLSRGIFYIAFDLLGKLVECP